MAPTQQEPEGQETDATAAEEAEPTASDATSDDELKRKFREALERKRNAQADANAKNGNRGRSKIGGAHGPASQRRSFRRKSG
ncbi:DUF5302 domain-containing protein [Spongiactinospora sp. 9N601]|uniref:DUF5302 domain-containing protein n=1 Tax=Spongiactinospora sp. 9N601 TaxID=3375149 RepID=UPI00379DB45B